MTDRTSRGGVPDPLLTPVFLADGTALGESALGESALGEPAMGESAPGEHSGAGPPVYYVLASNGLFLVREHAFFRSSLPAPTFPSELAEQEEYFEPRFPRIPQILFERIVGFFAAVARAHGAEAGVLLYWDQVERCVHAVAPPQTATTSGGTGAYGYPVGLHYEVPMGLPAHWTMFGDVHSHAALPAYASSVDQHDETNSPGLHIVVGRIHEEPPAFHVEGVVDEKRFPLAIEDVVEGYEKRRSFPRKWARRIRIMDVAEFERDRRIGFGKVRAGGVSPEEGAYRAPAADGVAGGRAARVDEAQNGAAQNGAASNGATQNGAAQNGAPHTGKPGDARGRTL